MNIKPDECKGCSLYERGKGFLSPDGDGTNGVILVGEGAGHREYLEGTPFRPKAEAGSVLETVFRILSAEMGMPVSREQFRLWNVIGCQPPSNILAGAPYELSAINHCNVHFDKIVGDFSTPFDKTVVAFGNIPLKRLTGVTGDAEYKESISHLRGYVFKSGYGWIVPTYHPSYIRRGAGYLMPVLIDDIKKAINVARGNYTSFKGGKGYAEPNYITKPSLDDAWSYYYRCRDNYRLPISYDIETPLTGDKEEDEKELLDGPQEIILSQFSLKKGEAIAFPWEGEYKKIARMIYALDNVKAGHNVWNFDNPILRANGIEFGNGKIHDTMWMFKHWYPNLERGLQKVVSLFKFPFPWKHLYGSMLDYYGCADVDAIQYILAVLPSLMKDKGVWNGYTRYVYDIHLEFDKMVARGVPVDEGKRLELEKEFTEKLEVINLEMQEIYPKELKGISPRQKVIGENGELLGYNYGYVRQPKDATIALAKGRELGLEGRELGVYVKDTTGYFREDMFNPGEQEWVNGLEVRKFVLLDGEEVLRWCRVMDFKPSSQQVIAYLEYKQEVARTKKEAALYKVPLTLKPNPKTGVKHKTTGKDELIPIWEATDDKLLGDILKYRSLKKMVTNDIPNWKPDHKTGRVHAEIGYTAFTGQKNARKPNIFNASKHATPEQEILWRDDVPPTKRFREMICAPPGYCFLEFDKKSFHVGMMGFISEDRDYFRFSQLNPHSIFTSWIVEGIQEISLDWSDEDILLACKEVSTRFKQVRQQQAKPTILGNQLGLGPYKLQRQNRKFIKTIRQAEFLQDKLKHRFVKVERTKERLIEDAWQNGWLGIVNQFQRIQYFYDVFAFHYDDKKHKWNKDHGTDYEKVLAFHVQSPCFGMIDDEILEFGRLGIDEEYGFVNTIHDSTIFLTEVGKRDRCIEDVYKVMTIPNKRLVNKIAPNGLVINVEVSVGKNGGSLKDMEEIKYPQ